MTAAASPKIESHLTRRAIIVLVGASAVSALVGAGAGVLMASIAPVNGFTWVTLLLIPIYFALEAVFELFVEIIGSHSRIARIAVMIALLVGFYMAWFWVRPL